VTATSRTKAAYATVAASKHGLMNMDKLYHFTVSEVFPDGRVLVVTCVHIPPKITLVMDIYNDMTLTEGRRTLNIHMNDNQALPIEVKS
jgi:hypothetical protein